MTDFYTVLQTALSRVGAVDEGARQRIYSHIREAMASKLRNLDPPLTEAQVSARLDDFDVAIDRIERELIDEQAEAADPPPERASNGAAVAAGYDEAEFEEEPSVFDEPVRRPPTDRWNGGGRAREEAMPRDRSHEQDRGWERREISEEDEAERFDRPFYGGVDTGADAAGDDEAASIDNADDSYGYANTADEDVARPNGHDRYADGGWDTIDEPDRDDRGGQAEDHDGSAWPSVPGRQTSAQPAEPAADTASPTGWRDRLRAGGLFGRSRDSGSAPEPEHAEHDEPAPERRRRRSKRSDPVQQELDPIARIARNLSGGRRKGRAEPTFDGDPVAAAAVDGDVFSTDLDYGEAPSRRQSRRARKQAAAEAKAAERRNLSPNRRRIWLVAILVVAIGIMAWAGSVFIPLLSPDGPSEETAAAAAPANPVAAADAPAADPAAPAPVAALPPQPAPAQSEPIILFQGADPTVFEAGPENPVRYQGDADGGLARISSSISSGGARAVIGPGLVEAIAGHVVRIVIDARGTPGQAAATVNLTYQRGQSTLQMRQANLPTEFGPIAATWSIPAEGGIGGDYLQIDPGVPGDGTAIDIRSIRIEIIN